MTFASRAGSHASRRRREAEKPKKKGKNQNWVERWITMEHDAAVHAFGSTWVHCLGCKEVVSIDDRAHFSRYGFVKHMRKCSALTEMGVSLHIREPVLAIVKLTVIAYSLMPPVIRANARGDLTTPR
jgi:hypothetical protein